MLYGPAALPFFSLAVVASSSSSLKSGGGVGGNGVGLHRTGSAMETVLWQFQFASCHPNWFCVLAYWSPVGILNRINPD